METCEAISSFRVNTSLPLSANHSLFTRLPANKKAKKTFRIKAMKKPQGFLNCKRLSELISHVRQVSLIKQDKL